MSNKNYTFKIEDATGRPLEHRIDIWASSPTEAYGQLCLQQIGEPGHIRILSCSANNGGGVTEKIDIPPHTLMISGVVRNPLTVDLSEQVNWAIWEELARTESWDVVEEIKSTVTAFAAVDKPYHVSGASKSGKRQWKNFFPQAKEVGGKVVYYISDLKNRTYLHKGAFEMVSAMTAPAKYVFDTEDEAIDKINELESELETAAA